jgi:hypothetical protein
VQHPQNHALFARESVAHVGDALGDRSQICPAAYGLNSVFSFFFTATPLMVT